jgi:TolB protein
MLWLMLILLLLPACGTLEVNVLPPTSSAPTATPAPVTVPLSPPATTGATPTPYIDHWTRMTFPNFGITLERPPQWEADPAYSDLEGGATRFAGITGFVQVGAMSSGSLDEAVEAEAGHHLQPYGAQPIIETMEVDDQPARLIMPSDDQSADPFRRAAVIARYPQPIELSGQAYEFLILWADPEHVRAIAHSVRFNDAGFGETPTPVPPLSWDHLPPGLAYTTSEGLWLVDGAEQQVLIHDNPQAVLSADGSRLLSYDLVQQDAWLIDRGDGAVLNLTRTPDRLECCFQWWPQRPDLVLFGSAAEVENPLAVRYHPTVVGLDGDGYQILDSEHAINVAGADGAMALSPDGRAIAYGAGQIGWFYRHGADGPEPFYPRVYGLDVDEPFQIAQPAWSPDGTHLAWIVKGGVTESGSSDWTGVAVFDLTARVARIVHQYESQGVGWPPAPVWSPDGQWLAFIDSSPSEYAGLWVARVGTAVEMQHLQVGGNPVWSPDGQWLAFQSMTSEVGPPTFYALAEVGLWELDPLDIPVDGQGQLVAWVDLGIGAAISTTITGVVMDVSTSARIITLEEPVEGINVIALTEESVLLSADESEILLHDIPLGATVKAFGQPDTSDALIADHILVTGAQ